MQKNKVKKLRILQINAGSQFFGGVSAMVFNLYRQMSDRVVFDFLTPNRTTYSAQKAEILSRGGKVMEFGINSKNLPGKLKLYFALKKFLGKRKYDIIHINAGVLLFNYVVACACRKYSNAKIIVHSHSNGGRSGLKEKLSSPLKHGLSKRADRTIACSDSAAEYMFDEKKVKKTLILKNGIDVERFRFNEETREKLRKEKNLDGNFVIGHIGRFMPEKNHEFLLDVFAECAKREKNSKLLLAGEGELLPEIRDKAVSLGLEDRVVFLGPVTNPEEWYQTMDVFVLPSHFEGFGIVNIEAQAAGLPCVISDAVPEEVDVSGHVDRLPLSAGKNAWADKILAFKGFERQDGSQLVRDAGFDIRKSADELLLLYRKLTGIGNSQVGEKDE